MKTPSPPRFEPVCRRRPSAALRELILLMQEFRCLGCARPLEAVEFDHVLPLGLGGDNGPENWAALCATCHRQKTVEDIKRIAKAERQRRYHETGKGRALRAGAFSVNGFVLRSRGFDRAWRRHLNGSLTLRCSCALCASPRVGSLSRSEVTPGADDVEREDEG